MNKVFRFVPRNRIVTNTFKVKVEERGSNYSQNHNFTNILGPSLKAFPQFDSDSFFDQPIAYSEFVGQNSPPQQIIASMPELGYFN